MDWSNLTNAEKEELFNYYAVMNGIGNQNPYNSPGYMFNFETDLANADPATNPDEGIALISLFNDMVPVVTTDALTKIVGDSASLLFSELRDYGNYIEEGAMAGSGKLTKEFYDLTDYNELILSPDFTDKREEIFNFLRELNRSLYDNVNDLGANVKDWIETQKVAAEIFNSMKAQYGEPLPADITGLCYSGSGDPFLHLLNSKPTLDVNSVVLVGTPIKSGRYIENENVETVVNIFGENDPFWYANTFARRSSTDDGDYLFRNNPRQINEFAIESKGVDHTHYFYDPNELSGDVELKQKASRFIAEITHYANDKEQLKYFLDANPGVTKDSTGKYIVDLDKVVY